MNLAHNIVGPNSPIQSEFLECPAFEAGYFGGKKSGKTAMCVLLPIRYIQDPRFRCLIVRRETPDLAYLEEVANAVYKRACPGMVYNQTKHLFTFPHPERDEEGAKVRLGFCKAYSDCDNYQGWKLQMLILDELTQWPDDRVYTTLAGELLAETDEETGEPWMRTMLRCTSNPMGRGSSWVKKRFQIAKFPEGKDPHSGKRMYFKDEESGLYRAYFKGTARDNPAIDHKQYFATLRNQSEQRQKAMIDGEWIEESSAFVEFDPKIHVVDDFQVPRHYELVLSGDHGYSTWAAFHLWAVNPDNRGAICIAEWSLTRTHPLKCAEIIRERMEALGYSFEDLEDAVIGGDAFGGEDDTGLSPAHHMMDAGIPWRPVDRSRDIGFQAVVNRLTTMVERPDGSAVPSVRFMRSRCPMLIETLPMLPKKEGEDDIDKVQCKAANDLKGNDHWYDSMRHFVMGQPVIEDVTLEERDDALGRRDRMPHVEDMTPYNVGIPRGY